jgi:hypothetical protein
MGAGTILVPAISNRRCEPIQGKEERVLALLSVAYGRMIPASILSKIERSAESWAGGEDCLALIHLALAGLHQVDDRRETARRLFIADGLMKAGIAPSTILQALDLDGETAEPLERYMNTQPRAPKGSPTGGQWVRGIGSALANLSEAAGRFLSRFAAARAASPLRGLAANPITLGLGLVLIPRTTDLRTAGIVPDIPDLSYAWNRDQTVLRLTYDTPNGLRDIAATLDADGTFRDGDQVVARLLPDGTLAIDPAKVSSDLADKDGPNLCPTPVPDKLGRVGPVGEKDKDYEDQIKQLVNPDNPTPRGYGYSFYDPERGANVFIDDCQHQTGMRVEIKSEYDDLLQYEWGRNSLAEDWLEQSKNQLSVSKRSPLTWVFAQKGSADFTADLFSKGENGQKRIVVTDIPRFGAPQ